MSYSQYYGQWGHVKVDMGFSTGIILWTLQVLESLCRMRVLLAYETNIGPSSYVGLRCGPRLRAMLLMRSRHTVRSTISDALVPYSHFG